MAPDGSPLFYRQLGSGEGPVAVLCDGIGCDGYIWKYLAPELAAHRTVLHWHYRGHGRTPAPRSRRHVELSDLVGDLTAVLEATVGTDRPLILIGHSMGVQVCLEAYRRERSRVAALVLLCGSYGTPLRTFKGTNALEGLLPWVRLLVEGIPDSLTGLWQRALPTELAYQIATRLELNGALIRRDDFFPYLEHMAQVDLRLFLDLLAAAGRHSAKDLLPRVTVPTLIVSGERDGFTPPALSEEMHREIPGAELHVVEAGSHTAPIERPSEVNDRILAFLGALA